jgi:hypothetical protein
LVTNGEFVVRDEVGCPDSITGRVSIPLRVLFRWIANVVNFVSWVVGMNVDGCTINCSVDIVGCIFNLPEPVC